MTTPESRTCQALDPARFEGEVGGQPVRLFTLRGSDGFELAVCNLGAKILQMLVPDERAPGGRVDVVLGHDSLTQLLDGLPSVGAFVGRYANRIAGASFPLDGRSWHLTANDGPHCLHGGTQGSRHRVFAARQSTPDGLELTLVFEDGEQGFPGRLVLDLSYRLLAPATLVIEYRARCEERATVANFTSHCFFNLAGHAAGDVRAHRFTLTADRFLPVNATRIPQGPPEPVSGRALDFRRGRSLTEALAMDDPQLDVFVPRGIDHAFLTTSDTAGQLSLQARVEEPVSGRWMEAWSTESSLQLYAGAALDGSLPRHAGKHGAVYGPFAGFCLEPQYFPDAPNRPDFPSTVLRPGQQRSGRMEYRFGTPGASHQGARQG